jgi:hypothetical protein
MERERAYMEQHGQQTTVTVLSGKIGARTGKTNIRDSFGSVYDVPSKSLTKIDPKEPHAKLTFEVPGE